MAEAKKRMVKVRLLQNYFTEDDKKVTPEEVEEHGLELPMDKAERACDLGIAEPFSRFGEEDDKEEE